MKLRYFFAAMLLCGASAVANAQSIGEQELAQIKGSFVKDAHTTAVQNILLGDAKELQCSYRWYAGGLK